MYEIEKKKLKPSNQYIGMFMVKKCATTIAYYVRTGPSKWEREREHTTDVVESLTFNHKRQPNYLFKQTSLCHFFVIPLCWPLFSTWTIRVLFFVCLPFFFHSFSISHLCFAKTLQNYSSLNKLLNSHMYTDVEREREHQEYQAK